MERRGPLLLLGLATAALLTLAVGAVPGVRPSPGVLPWLDNGVQPLGHVLASGAAAWAAATSRGLARWGWGLVAAALTVRTTALAYAVLLLDRSLEQPRFAVAGWLLAVLLLVGGLVLLTQAYRPPGARVVLLDAVMGALTAAAVATIVFRDALGGLLALDARSDTFPTGVVFPLVEIVLLSAFAALVAGTHVHLSRAVLALGAGVLAFVVTDGLQHGRLAAEQLQPGTVLAPLILASSVLVAAAPWWGSDVVAHKRAVDTDLSVPRVLAVTCLAVLGAGAFVPVPAYGTVLAVAGMVAGLFRSSLTQSIAVRRSTEVIAEMDEELASFRALVEASRDFIALGTIRGQVLYLNPAGRELVGIPRDGPLPGLTIGEMLTPDAARHQRDVERPQILATGSWRGESTLLHRDGGEPVPVFKNTFIVRHEDGSPWLLGTIQRDITDLHAARRQLQQLADDRQVLLRHLVDAQEAERTRIAGDVHDDPVQVMAAVDLQLGLAQRQLELGAEAADVAASLAQMRDTVAEANDRLRYLLFDLDSPAQREDIGTALGEAAAYVLGESVRTEVRCEDGLQLDPTVRVLVYRIAKEAMVNVRKHAAASRVDLRVRSVDGGVEVTVSDDGVGIAREEPAPQPGHRGLSDMRDRAAIAGGTVTIGPGAERGTVVRLWIPLSADAD